MAEGGIGDEKADVGLKEEIQNLAIGSKDVKSNLPPGRNISKRVYYFLLKKQFKTE